jgi:hypothetical protein
MQFKADISIQDLSECVTEECTQKEVFELIKLLDLGQADYDFTLKLTKYLVKELKRSSSDEEPFDLSELNS